MDTRGFTAPRQLDAQTRIAEHVAAGIGGSGAEDRLAARARSSKVAAEHADDDVPGKHIIDDPVAAAPLRVDRVSEDIWPESASC